MKAAEMEEQFARLQFSPTVCVIYKVRRVKDNGFVGSKSPLHQNQIIKHLSLNHELCVKK